MDLSHVHKKENKVYVEVCSLGGVGIPMRMDVSCHESCHASLFEPPTHLPSSPVEYECNQENLNNPTTPKAS